MRRFLLIYAAALLLGTFVRAEDGYDCWLRYQALPDSPRLEEYRTQLTSITALGKGLLLDAASDELTTGLSGLLGRKIDRPPEIRDGTVLLSTSLASLGKLDVISPDLLENLGPEGFLLRSVVIKERRCILIVSKGEPGLLHGAFHLLRLVQTLHPLNDLNIQQTPGNPWRMVDHWDNPMSGSVERGYAGRSIFFWEKLPDIDSRYRDYARMLASVGINGIVLNNVNTSRDGWQLLTSPAIVKMKALAEVFRKYGIKIFISINYASPMLIGKLSTADPLDGAVEKWWKAKADEIYQAIPDFGGFLVKADSEGQPGPQKYGRNHAEGSAVLAKALKPHGGIVIWRAFVYGGKELNPDRAAQVYQIFKPLDGKFEDNVILQVKNGPIDFQVREPASPLFGAMPRTNLMIELQITQEYTGQSTHLCYLVPQWKEVLDFDTYCKGPGSSIKNVVGGSLNGLHNTGIDGVANIGDNRNWTGHLLAQANAYGFGRLAWDPNLSAKQIANEWIQMTFGHEPVVQKTLSSMLLDSWSIYEKYTSPLGLGMICARRNHFEPDLKGRQVSIGADKTGVGNDRTLATGSGFTAQFQDPWAKTYDSLETCPDSLLLLFHHVPYTHRLKSGKTIIQHIYDTHFEGVDEAKVLRDKWLTLKGKIDNERHAQVLAHFDAQIAHAEKWRDAVNHFFFTLSGIPDEKGRLK